MRLGFSLVELSIVLVILGLLTGGILAGQSLIRASELRTITNDRGKYTTAVMTFRDKYLGLPGDITNATTIWPSATNGNGDGFLGTPCSTGGSDATIASCGTGWTGYNEFYKAWHQLAQAGLVEGSFTGTVGPSHPYRNAITGTNVPPARIGNAAWCFGPPFSGWRVNGDYTNSLTIGGNTGSTDVSYCAQPFLKPEEAWNIDTKLDDGLPGRGKVIGMPSSNTCTTAHTTITNLDGAYVLTGTSGTCLLNFKVM